ncbi:hypothetical protein [Ureibacillus sinduriensis]|uniref:hypothetical protein n=1 Tax=Ureibacillus sinduriensis TaxID=561440 RepID=UPI0011250CF9|nr:hypothetical protein [Ureibacillus sinduriensis]
MESIYYKKPQLNEIIPFYELSPQIELFLNEEVRLGARNLNPYRFSLRFAHEPKDVINLFVAFSSENGPLMRLYRCECIDCEQMLILNDEELKEFKCYNCGSTGNLELKDFLDNVKVIFEIKEKYIKDVKARLKEQASSDASKKNTKSEEAIKGEVSLKDVFDLNAVGSDNELLEIEKSVMHKITFGLTSI